MSLDLYPCEPSTSYTKVPNEILSATDLSPQEKVIWCQLESLCYKGERRWFRRSFLDISDKLSIKYDGLMRSVRALKDKGYLKSIDYGYQLIIPETQTEIVSQPETLKEVEQVEDFTIRKAVEQKPNQKPTGIDPKESWINLCEAWNRNKPDSWLIADGPFNQAVFMTISEHCKRLDIARADLPAFVGQVARGCSIDSWWKDKSGICIPQVFGYYVAKLNNQKYQTVEKLYRLGAKKVDKFSWDDDDSVLYFYKNTCPDLHFNSVKRLTFTRLSECIEHEKENQGNGIVYIYSNDDLGKYSHWSHRLDKDHRKCNNNPAAL